MAPNVKLRERLDPGVLHDPREGDGSGGAEVIDLATRNVLPQVSQRKRSDSLGMVAGIAIVAALGAVTLWAMSNSRDDPRMVRVELPEAQPLTAPGDPLSVQTQARTSAAGAPRPGIPAPPPSSVLARPPQMAISPVNVANPHSSPAMIFDSSAVPGASGAPGLVTPGSVPTAAGMGNSNDDFAARIGGVGGTTATASSSFDPATTVTQGTLIPAVLETAIDTDVPGYVRAIVSTDVKSFDGRRVLVPRSSRLIGQYKSGLSAGQKRAYVIWTRLIRPDGVSVNLGSPAIGFNGETGIAGKVDSHFFARFGSAMLLSVVGGLSTIATGGAGVVIAGGGQSAAAAAVQQNGQLGPTIRVRQGEPIRVFTAKDLDFSKVS